MSAEFECFCDLSYYDLWAVRAVGEKRWGHCFHVQTKEEAEGLRDTLSANARLIAAAPETAKERDELKACKADLLAALEKLLLGFEDMMAQSESGALDYLRAAHRNHSPYQPHFDKARAAIARAKGVQS